MRRITDSSLARAAQLTFFAALPLYAATPERGFIYGTVHVRDRAGAERPARNFAVILTGNRYVDQARTDDSGNFQLDVEVGLWKIISGYGYEIETKSEGFVGQGRSAPARLSPAIIHVTPSRTASYAGPRIIFVAYQPSQADAPPFNACPSNSNRTGNLSQARLRICSSPGTRISMYDLPEADSKVSIALLDSVRVSRLGDAELSLSGVVQSPQKRFVISAWDSDHNPAAIVLTRSELLQRLSSGQGVELRLSERVGNFEPSSAGDALEELGRRASFLPRLMEALPVPGIRSLDAFALLAPGVAPAPQTLDHAGPGIGRGIGTAGQFSVNGLRSRENNFNVDGSDNNDDVFGVRRQGFVAPAGQTIDSIVEFQIITAFGDARFGRNIGGQVNVLGKTGLQDYHGTAYGFLTDSRIAARNYFDEGRSTAAGTLISLDGSPASFSSPAQGKPPATRLQSGLMLTGPASLSATSSPTFFTAAVEGLRTRATRQEHFRVPSVPERGLAGTGAQGLPVPFFRVSPASFPGNALYSLVPFPNDPIGPFGANTYTTLSPADQDAVIYSLKGEHILNVKSKRLFVTGRFNGTAEGSTLPDVGHAIDSSISPKFDTDSAVLFLTTAISPGITNAFRTSFGRTRSGFVRTLPPRLLASSRFPGDPYLLNAPLLINITRPGGTSPLPQYIFGTSDLAVPFLNALAESGLPNRIPGTDLVTGPLGRIEIAGFDPVGADPRYFPQSRHDHTWQWNDDITFVKGRLTFITGFDIRRLTLDSTIQQNARPTALFGGLLRTPDAPNGGFKQQSVSFPNEIFTATTLVAAGIPSALFQTLSNSPDYGLSLHKTEADYFAQSRMRLKPSLALSLGLRLETSRLPGDIGQHLSRAFDIATLRSEVSEARSNPACTPNCTHILDALGSQFPADFGQTFGADSVRADVRLGVSWAPSALPQLTLRSAFGTYSGQFPAVILTESRSTFPDFLSLNFSGPSVAQHPSFLWNPANPLLPNSSATGPLQVVAPNTLDLISPQTTRPGATPIQNSVELLGLATSTFPNIYPGLILSQPAAGIRSPMAFQYGITSQYEFSSALAASLAYVAAGGRHLLRISTPDLGLNRSEFRYDQFTVIGNAVFPRLAGTPLSPQSDGLRQYLPISRLLFEGSSSSSYQSLQAELKRRWPSGLQFGAAFTWSHSIDDASDFFDLAGSYALPQDSVHRSERGDSNYDARLRFVSHFAWEPAKVHGWRRWQVSGVYSAQSGQPYTVNSSIDINRDGNLTDRLDNTEYLIRHPSADRRMALALSPGIDSLKLLALSGNSGRVGRNAFRARGIDDLDFALAKYLPLSERLNLLLRAEVYNALNRTHFGIPVRTLESPGFGSSFDTIVPSRTIQFALRLSF